MTEGALEQLLAGLCLSLERGDMSEDTLLKTPLYDLHVELGAKMVPFAGYAMPVQYPLGVLKEHNQTRESAGLFDVSHMGQCYIHAKDGNDPAIALEKIIPGALQSLKPGKMRLSVLLNEDGGIEDDLMVTRSHDADGKLYVVVNAACKDKDYAIIEEKIGHLVTLEPIEDHALIALQGPKAESALASLAPDVANLGFMEGTAFTLEGVVCWVSRCGYTGEDGYEISVPEEKAEALTRTLLAMDDVEAIGLGARDSLRLESGLCLSGHDFDGSITPVEANLVFTIGLKRREIGDFPGGEKIVKQISEGVTKKRVGILPVGRAPAREGTEIVNAAGEQIGVITSGGFGPTVGKPIAMGYVDVAEAEEGTEITLMIRGKGQTAHVAAMPFIEQRYMRKTKN